MNSFERFGINHLSPSSLNLWRAAPGLWTLRYVGGIREESSPAMRRGTAVESGLAALLRGMPLDGATAVAHQNFDVNTPGIGNEESDAEQELITPMLRMLATWKAPGNLSATQIKIEYFFDPLPIPVIGYLDFAFDLPCDVDLKSTKAIPSIPRPDNRRQVSLYRGARNRPGGLLYVSAKRHAYYEVTDEQMNDDIESMAADALALNNFLARCDTKQDALKSLPIDWTHFQAPKVKIPLSELLLAG